MITASAPGSVMLMGEHAVLYGHRALVLAVDQRLTVTLTERADDQIIVTSSLGHCRASIHALPEHAGLRFVCQAIGHCQPKQGFELEIHSQINHTHGLASSAAATVATLAALQCFQGQALDHSALLEQAVKVIRCVQGRGSGSDAAACIYGGAVAYDAKALVAESVAFDAPFGLYYLGYKTPTPEVLSYVSQRSQRAPGLYQQLYGVMGAITEAALSACQQQDLAALAEHMTAYQGCLHAIGVADSATLSTLAQLAQTPQCLGAKISGSGLGDCVIALGQSLPQLDAQLLAIDSTDIGVTIEQS